MPLFQDKTFAGEPVTELQSQLAQSEFMAIAKDLARQNGWSLMQAFGHIDSELRKKVRAEESIRGSHGK